MVLDLLIPERCASCGEVGASPCRRCWQTLRRPAHLPVPPPLASLHAPLSYEGAARELVARLKYRNNRSGLRWLAAATAAVLPEAVAASCLITWAPTTDLRRRERGFDHAELLAGAVAEVLDRPLERLLRRHPGRPQTGLTPRQRRANAPNFSAVGLTRGCVVVVDDVVTTGATLGAAGAELREAGATSVIGLVAAATPLKPISD